MATTMYILFDHNTKNRTKKQTILHIKIVPVTTGPPCFSFVKVGLWKWIYSDPTLQSQVFLCQYQRKFQKFTLKVMYL